MATWCNKGLVSVSLPKELYIKYLGGGGRVFVEGHELF